MGDRGQIKIADTGVYLYTHWGSSEIIDNLRKSIGKKQRWSDPEYLTRIIFDEMKRDSPSEETGFGIGTEEHGDINRLIEVNCEDQTIKYGEIVLTFEDFIK